MNLFEIIEKYNLNPTTDKNSVHCYIKGYYEMEFSRFKDEKISFLEIGVRSGGSMKLWSEYFENAESIVGIDIDESCINSDFKNLNNVTYYFGDAYSSEIVNKIGDIDIFLDDGPHTLESQIKAIEYYLPKVRKGGLFLIEDVQEESWFDSFEGIVDSLEDGREYEVERVDLRHMKNMYGDHRYDDLIFSVKVK